MTETRTAPVGVEHRIPSLDGLRAFAIACVLGTHVFTTINPIPPTAATIRQFFPQGGFGVHVFFVLSGFLITTLLLREREKHGSINLRDFYVRRAYRILPAYYLFLAVIAVLVLARVIELNPLLIAAAALFIRDYVPTGGSWWVGHTWSISIEEQFYLLWPLLLRKLSLRRARQLLVAGIILSPVVRMATWALLPPLRPGIEIMLHTRADGLLVGCLLATLWTDPAFRARMDRYLSKGLGWVAVAWLIPSWYLSNTIQDGWNFTVGYAVDALAVAVIVVWVIQRPRTIGGRILNWRPIAHLGVISYSLYLWQQVFLSPEDHSIFGWFPLNLVFAIGAAELSYWFVERPFLRLRQKRAEARRSVAVSAG